MKIVPLLSKVGQRGIFLSLIFTILSLISLYHYYSLDHLREQHLHYRLDAMLGDVRLIALAHDQWLKESKVTGEALAIVLPRLDMAAQCRAIRKLMADSGLFDQVLLALPNGDVTCAAVPSERAVNLRDRDYFQQALRTGEFASGDYIIGRISKTHVLPMAYPIKNERGEIIAVVVLVQDLSWLSEVVLHQSVAEAGEVLLVNSEGSVLNYSSDFTQEIERPFSYGPLFQHMLELGQGTYRHAAAGQDLLFGFARLEGLQNPHYVVFKQPTDQVLAQVKPFFRESLVIFLLIALLIMSVLWFALGFFVVTPMESLICAMKRVAHGDLWARVDNMAGSRELNYIALNFNAMVDNLQQSTQELRRVSLIDSLLKINNRRALDEQSVHEWERCIRRGSPLTLLLLEPRYYRRLFENYGHQTATHHLQNIANICLVSMRQPNHLVARYSGETLAILMPDSTEADARATAEIIQTKCAKLAIPGLKSAEQHQPLLTVSIASSAQAESRSQLFSLAEAGLFRAHQDVEAPPLLPYEVRR